MSKKKTASADEAVMPDAIPALHVDGCTLTRVTRDGVSHPTLLFTGETPQAGQELFVTLENGVTYAATVSEAVEVGGEIMCELVDGLKAL